MGGDNWFYGLQGHIFHIKHIPALPLSHINHIRPQKMTITQLEYVVAVATYKSFVAAAEKCFVTQPTLSMQIQKLEDELGVKIFDRNKHPIAVSEMGEMIVGQARVALAECERIHEIING